MYIVRLLQRKQIARIS